jgi:hypothetical protein
MLENELALKARVAVSGPILLDLLASLDRATLSWRTSQLCLDGELDEFSETWPRSGMMLSGTAYRLAPLAPLTDETVSGVSLGTPTAVAKERTTRFAVGRKPNPAEAARLWPSPTARDTKGRDANCREGGPSLPEVLYRASGSGKLNPPWVEWLMGYPIGHTELKPSETP